MKIDYSRRAHVSWQGDLDGNGTLTTESHSLGEQPVSFYARLNHPKRRYQTTPEELLAAAHATDFAMIMAVVLSEAGHTPESVQIDATCSWERLEQGGYKIFAMALDVQVRAPGLDVDELSRLAAQANELSPISLALRNNVEITVSAALTGDNR